VDKAVNTENSGES